MKKIFFLSIFILLFSYSSKVLAQDITVSCNGAGNCSVNPPGPLFSASQVWYPGESLTKTVRITNNSSSSQSFGTRATNNNTSGDLDMVTNLSLVRVSTADLIWSGSLSNFYTLGELDLGIYAPGAFEDYDFIVSMPLTVSNEYQNKETVFDLLLGFLGTETIVSPTTITEEGGGGVAGDGVSTSICSDEAPGSAPTLISATAGVNSVTLVWTEAKDPITYYLVAFGTNSAADQYGNPNVGGKGTNTYTISGLSGGTMYYFKVRAGNGCMPSPFSNIISAIPAGEFISGIPSGFASGVLGIKTKKENLNETDLDKTKPTVLGEKAVGVCQKCFWWPIILIGAIMQLLLTIILKSRRMGKIVVYNLILGIVTYLVFLWFNRYCLNGVLVESANWFCRYFILLVLGESLLFNLVIPARR